MEPKSFRLLQLLIENRDRTLLKDEIVAAVWAGTFVTDNSITRAITQIRKALHDDAKEPRYIETVPTVGYRFIGDVKAAFPADLPQARADSPAAETIPNDGGRKRRRALAVALAVGLCAAVLLGVWWQARRGAESPLGMRPVKVRKLTQFAGEQTDPAFSPDG